MMHYRRVGTGKLVVVLLHGFGEDSRIWKHQENFLRDKFTLIIPDLPGCGKSGHEADLGMENLAHGIDKILRKENVEKAAMIGHSMGGYIALAFAALFPAKLSGLGLFHSTAFADSAAKKEARQKSIAFIREHGNKLFLETTTPNLFAESNRPALQHLIAEIVTDNSSISPETLIGYYEAMMARPDRTAILRNNSLPVLFVVGKYDIAVPFSDSMQQVYLPDLSYIHVLENSGHMGMLEETDKSNQALEKFLDDLS
ncbi:alpha/beta hydrolase [Flavihumibacter rivuli]|uniref:alpha/beta fold hydrolase n=1 Tax=Flavihumibacter rivuli TaxID=2838156 RepID=UPI001BDF65B6|nr:alpha/beta hydrolase [Flavihumibacter rivuli]ULQ56772.1 alpha/beta hydrolase [Flavihumibacter rivuli]